MNSSYPSPEPLGGRWPNRAALAEHMAERHGRDIDEPHLPPLPFRKPGDEPLAHTLATWRTIHRALHRLDAGPDHEHGPGGNRP